MANWDIFLADRLEVARDLSPEAVRDGIASGAIRADDLARPSGSSTPWARVGDTPGLLGPPAGVGLDETQPGPIVADDAIDPDATRVDLDHGRDIDREARPPAGRAGETMDLEAPTAPPGGTSDDHAPPPPADRDLGGGAAPPSRGDFDDDLVELHPTGDHPARAPGPPPDREGPTGWSHSTFEQAEDDDLDPDGPALDAAIDEDEEREEELGFPEEPEVLDEDDLALGDEEERTVELRRPPEPASPPGSDRDDWDDLVAAAGGSMPPPGLADPDAPPAVDPLVSAFPGLDEPEAFDPLDEDDEAAAFTLAADPATEPDEIDLTAMVDVAFQLVLFFLVTATTLYFKTLEIPSPEPDDPDAVAQQMRTLDELLDEYILVEIDPAGRVEVDREPVSPDELTERLRKVRADTLRTGMLLMADFATPHRNAVLAIDSANAVGLEIAIAKPSAPDD